MVKQTRTTLRGVKMKGIEMSRKSIVAVLVAAGMLVAADGPFGRIRYKLEYLPDQEKARNTITRAYLGYEGSLNESVSGKVTADVGPTDDGSGKQRFEYYLKHAQIKWTLPIKEFDLKMGLFGPAYQEQADKNWGYSFLVDLVILGKPSYKGSTGKANGIGLSSADVGAELGIKINENVKAYVGLLKGDGYKNIGVTSDGDLAHPMTVLQFDIKAGVMLASVGGIIRQHAHSPAGKDNVELIPNLHFGMKNDVLRAGLEAVARFNRDGSDLNPNQLFSAALYGVYAFVPGVEGIVRGEYFSTQEEESSSGRGIFGVAILPASKFRMVFHYDIEAAVKEGQDAKHVVGLATELSF